MPAPGDTLHTTDGTWTQSPTSFAYQWQTDASGSWADIGGATANSYLLVAGDNNHNIRSTVTASNASGAGTLASSNIISVGTPPSPPTGPTPPSPPPSTAGVQFDGRAINMSEISSTGLASQGNVVQSQAPSGMWLGLVFTNNDITLVSDARYGQVYRVRANGASTNPWYDDNTSVAAQLSTSGGNANGTITWYATSFLIESGFTGTDWGVVHQFKYPTLSSPPLGVSVDARGVGLTRDAGELFQNSSGFWAGLMTEPRFFPISTVIGKWLEMKIGVLWKFDNTGWIKAYTRCKDNGETGFTLRYNVENTPTWQYRHGAGFPTSSLDELGLYYGYGSPPASWPTNYVRHMGLVVCNDEATADSILSI